MGNYFGQEQARQMPDLPYSCSQGNQNVSYKLVKSWQDAGLPLCGPSAWPNCTRLPWPDDINTALLWSQAFKDVMDNWDKGVYHANSRGQVIDWSEINKGNMRSDPCDGTESWIQEFTTPALALGGMILWNMVSPFGGSAKGITTLSVGGFGYCYGKAIYAHGDEREKYGQYCMRLAGVFAGGAVGGIFGLIDEGGAFGNVAPVAAAAAGGFFGPTLLKEIPIINPIIPHKSGGGGVIFGLVSDVLGVVSWVNQKFRFALCWMLYKMKGECFGRVHWRLDTFAAAIAYSQFPSDAKRRRRLFNAIISNFSQYVIPTLPNREWGSHNIWQGSQRYIATCQDVKILLDPKSYGNQTYYGTAWVKNYQQLIDQVAKESADAAIYIPKSTCETAVNAAYEQSNIAAASAIALDYPREKDCKYDTVIETLSLLATGNVLRPYRDLVPMLLRLKTAEARCLAMNVITGEYNKGTPLATLLRNRYVHHTSPAAIEIIEKTVASCSTVKQPPADACKTVFNGWLSNVHRQWMLGGIANTTRFQLFESIKAKWESNQTGIPDTCDDSAWGFYGALACFGSPGVATGTALATPAQFLTTLNALFKTPEQRSAAVQTLIPAFRKWLPPWHVVDPKEPGGGQINWYFNHNKNDPAVAKIKAMVTSSAPVSFGKLWWTPVALKPKVIAKLTNPIFRKPFKKLGPTFNPKLMKPLKPAAHDCAGLDQWLSSESWVKSASAQKVKVTIDDAMNSCRSMPVEILFYIYSVTNTAQCAKYWEGLAKQPVAIRTAAARMISANIKYPHDHKPLMMFGDYVSQDPTRAKNLATWAATGKPAKSVGVQQYLVRGPLKAR